MIYVRCFNGHRPKAKRDMSTNGTSFFTLMKTPEALFGVLGLSLLVHISITRTDLDRIDEPSYLLIIETALPICIYLTAFFLLQRALFKTFDIEAQAYWQTTLKHLQTCPAVAATVFYISTTWSQATVSQGLWAALALAPATCQLNAYLENTFRTHYISENL